MSEKRATLVSVAQAQRTVLKHVRQVPVTKSDLIQAMGLTLAEDIVCDIDMPPFDRAMMDGFAVRSLDATAAGAKLKVVDHVAAGTSAQRKIEPGEAARINTGAPLPDGADSVIRIEDTEWTPDGGAVVLKTSVAHRLNVCDRAEYLTSGTVVLQRGTRLGPAQIAAAASAGADQVTVHRRPTFAVLATGNELIEAGGKPTGAQIRNSNTPMLAALLSDDGVDVVSLGIARDDQASLTESIKYGLECDGLCITGGVSMGAYDFVPEVLEQCGVKVHFHKMSSKPGKPSLFGTSEKGACVFGLPGNPVSAMIGYWLLARPAIACMQGQPDRCPVSIEAVLDGAQSATGDRDSYWPVSIVADEGGRLVASALSWRGSGDPFGMGKANGWIHRPAKAPAVTTGDKVQVILLERI